MHMKNYRGLKRSESRRLDYMWRRYYGTSQLALGRQIGDGARFRVDGELNALQNGYVAGLQGQFTDEGCSTCCVACDRYRGVICLCCAGEMGEDHKGGTNDG